MKYTEAIRKSRKTMRPTDRKPTSPGEILLEEFLLPLGISHTEFVEHLGKSWSQPKLSSIIRGKRAITIAIALDFADAFGTTPEFWINLQNNVHLWESLKEHKKIPKLPKLRRIQSKSS